MNTQQRGVYQPATDNIPIYDLSDEEMEEEEHSRLPVLIVIALLMLAAFAGVVWLAYNQGVERGRSGAAIVISAPDGPVRTAPADAGGAAAPYTGLKVYGQGLPPDQEAQASALAPSQDNDIPAVAVQPAAKSVTSDTPPVRLNPETRNATPPPATAPAKAAAQTSPAVQPTVIANVVAAAPAPAAPAATAVSAVSGKAVLQIGAYETPEIANGAWAAFKARHTSVVGKLSDDVQKADLGAKGTWYRLRVGPFVDKTSANTACDQLRAEGATCFVAAP